MVQYNTSHRTIYSDCIVTNNCGVAIVEISYVLRLFYFVVSMNGIAVEAEMVAEKPLLNSIHGCYSLAAGVASVTAGALTSLHLKAFPVYLGASILAIVW